MDFKVLHRLKAWAIVLKGLRAVWNRFIGSEISIRPETDLFLDDWIAGLERNGPGADFTFHRLDGNADWGDVWPRRNRALETHDPAYRHAGLGRNCIAAGHKVGLSFQCPGPAGVSSTRLIEKISVGGETRLKATAETDSRILDGR